MYIIPVYPRRVPEDIGRADDRFGAPPDPRHRASERDGAAGPAYGERRREISPTIYSPRRIRV